ncbi:unnamed protein product [Albugo candida]|uniref:Uncharacterized protein n=1 Tax=Albugo candida TaxID=65357 RepID=A0A024FT65_9STRA|nr:unnamed protein product [Albugo candida]|eukprot:CCI10067.1 unnamed protein product [Albugo candida]
MKLYWGIFTIVITSGLYTHWNGLPETYFLQLVSTWCNDKMGLSKDSNFTTEVSDDHARKD